MKTTVEWLAQELTCTELGENPQWVQDVVQQAKEMEKQRMIDLVQRLKDYTRESNNVLGFDEREASEFVDIFYNETFKSK